MTRAFPGFYLPAVLLVVVGTATMPAGPAHAACEPGGILSLCPDDVATAGSQTDDGTYERLDGGSYGGRPQATGGPTTYTLDDGTTVTLGETPATQQQPWQSFNSKTGDANSFKREDRARSGNLDPLSKQCHADGCY